MKNSRGMKTFLAVAVMLWVSMMEPNNVHASKIWTGRSASIFSRSGTPSYIAPDANNILYVKKGSTGQGSSWNDAMGELADALKWVRDQSSPSWTAVNPLKIYVAKGVYTPLHQVYDNAMFGVSDRDKAFRMENNVKIYGGFAGNETSLGARDPELYKTTLSGDLDGDGKISDGDAYHVVISAGDVGVAELNGVVVTGGNANVKITHTGFAGKSFMRAQGGGIYINASSPIISNVSLINNKAVERGGGMINEGSSAPEISTSRFENNQAGEDGGGMYNLATSTPKITNTNFEKNDAGKQGGGMYNDKTAAPIVTNCTFKDNTATDGAAVMVNLSASVFTNCTFSANRATGNGGGMRVWGASPEVINCTFIDNTAQDGGGVYNAGNTGSRIVGSTFRNNSSISGGGAIHNDGGHIKLVNSLIVGNSGGRSGGGMYNAGGSKVNVVNTTFSLNRASDGGGIFSVGVSTVSIFNSIVWGNTGSSELINNFYRLSNSNHYINNSYIEGKPGISNTNFGSLGEGAKVRINTPFIDSPNGDFSLRSGNEAVQGGSNEEYNIFSSSTLDHAGKSRFVEGTIDMGALEAQPIDMVPSANNIVYVNANVVGGNQSGNSWQNAIPEVAAALWQAKNKTWTTASPLKIYVAKGMYKPAYAVASKDNTGATTTARDKAFVMQSNVKLYGGFAGHEAALEERDWGINETVLSGSLGNGAAREDSDVYHVVIGAGGIGIAELNGFTVTRGHANELIGTINTLVNARPILRSSGGGIYLNQADLSLHNIRLINNSARYGAGVFNMNASPRLISSSFVNNEAFAEGSAMYSSGSKPVMTNLTLFSNVATPAGGAVYNTLNSNPTINNTIIWGNRGVDNSIHTVVNIGGSLPVVKNSYLQGTGWDAAWGTDGGSNITSVASPFVSATDLSPKVASLTIDGGENSLFPDLNAATSKDLAAKERIRGNSIDIGAYEYQQLSILPDADNVVYVNASVMGGDRSGKSWANAVPKLADVLLWAKASTWTAANPLKVYVAKGIYKPMYNAEDGFQNIDGGRDNAFVLVPNVQLYGGFAGNETDITDRDRFANETILSGDSGVEDNISDNAYHVVLAVGNVGNARLDGFTVTGGNAAGGTGDITVNGVLVARSSGGGISQNSAAAAIANCIFRTNYAENSGGAYYSISSSATISNLIFKDNHADYGAALFNGVSSAPRIISCVFYNNIATYRGGAMEMYKGSNPSIINSTIANNKAGTSGAGLSSDAESKSTVVNSIIWGNRIAVTNVISNLNAIDQEARTKVSYSYLEGVDDITGSNNVVNATSPFVDWLNHDYSLKMGGRAIDAGNIASYYGNVNVDTDVSGQPRIANRLIDMGAFEYQYARLTPDAGQILYVNRQVEAGNQSGDSWANAIPELGDALMWAGEQVHPTWNAANPLKIYVAQGTYYPLDKIAEVNNKNEPTSSGYKAFVMVKNVKLYGGFVGNETALEARSWKTNKTILSGNRTAKHVVISVGDVGETELNGFTITQGGALEMTNYPDGKSRHIVYKGYIIEEDKGGGMYNVDSSPRIEHCIFQGNDSALEGAGMYNDRSNPSIINSLFISNAIPRYREGGAIANLASSPVITNSTMVNNVKWNEGSEISNRQGSFPQINNSIIFSLTNVPNAIVSSDVSSKAVIKNSLLKYNPDYAWPTDFGEDGGGNFKRIIANFKIGNELDMIFEEGCVAINGGNDALYLAAGGSFETLDIGGNSRLAGCNIDMGAFEWQDPPACIEPSEDNVIYVNQAVIGGRRSGNNWEDAIPELATALQLASGKTWTSSNPLKIYVAKGTYKPMVKISNWAGNNPTTDRDMAFRLLANVQLYGGFEGNETALEARDWRHNETVLSGDLGVTGNLTDNAYHVVLSMGNVGQALMDGFVVRDGNANGYGIVSLFDDRIYMENGGGMYIYNSSPTIMNTIFTDNSSTKWGGGLYIDRTSSKVVNTIFANNTADNGGGIYIDGSPKIVNSTLTENVANGGGGLYYNGTANLLVSNTILWGNTNQQGEENDVQSRAGTVTFQNSYLRGAVNTDDGTNKKRTTSPFIASDNGNYELEALSDAIGAGDNALYSSVSGPDRDLNAQTRIVHNTIDMGPLEYQGPVITAMAKILIAEKKIAIGQTSLVTIVFDEPMTGLSIENLTAGNGVLSALTTTDGITWTAILTPKLDVHESNNVIHLDNTGVMDGAETPGVGMTASEAYAVYTKRPTARIVVSDVELRSGETSLVTIIFDKAVTGFDNDDLTVANGTLSTVHTLDNISWTATLIPSVATNEKSNSILLDNEGVADMMGNIGEGTTVSNNYVVRTKAGTLWVTSLLDVGKDGTIADTMNEDELDGDGLSLREALYWALAGDVISFDLGNAKDGTITLGTQLDIKKTVSINGDLNNDGIPDITISGGNKSRVMAISGGYEVQLTGLKLTKGMISSGSGGGLAMDNRARVVIRNSIITDNHNKGGNGGGLYGYSDAVTLINTTISNNSAAVGGGISTDGNTTVNLINSTVSGNASSNGGGGGMSLSSGTTVLVNATVSGNSAAGASSIGGGISKPSGDLHIYNSTIVGNAAAATSGGIRAGGTTTLVNTVVAGNRANNAGIGAVGGSALATGGRADDMGTSIYKAVNSYFGTDVTIDNNTNSLTNQGTANLLLENLSYVNGSNVQTHRPQVGSALIDVGSNDDLPKDNYDLNNNDDTNELLPVDANGDKRVDGTVDIGAVEVNRSFLLNNLNGGGNFIEKGSPVLMDTDVTVSHVDLDALNRGNGDYNGTSLVVGRSGTLDASDVFGFGSSDVVLIEGKLLKNGLPIADFDTSFLGKLTIRFTNANGETPSTADVNKILRQLTYSTNSQDPKPTVELEWTFYESNGGSASEKVKLTITPVNDAPTLFASGGSPNYTDKEVAVPLFSDAVVSTVEYGQLITGLTLTVNKLADGKDELMMIGGTEIALIDGAIGATDINSLGYSVSVIANMATIVLTSTGISTASVQRLINEMRYRNASDSRHPGNRIITLTSITDNGGTANGGVDHTGLSIAATVAVAALNHAPTISGSPATHVERDVAYNFIPTANDVDGDHLTFSITNKPNWATFDLSTGELSGTPGKDDVGITSGIVITVNDGTLSASLAAFDLEVVNVNDAPTISGTPDTIVERDIPYSFIPTVTDIDGDHLIFSITNKPSWAVFDAVTGELSGIPESGDLGITKHIIITVSDGTVSVSLPAFDLEVRSKKTLSGIVLEDNSFVYDGTVKFLLIKGVLPVGVTVDYTNNGRMDVGSQTVTVTVSGAGYVDLVLTAKLNIDKAKLSGITFADASFVYDGAAKSLALVGTLPTDAVVSYHGNGITESGEHRITVTISGSNNYADSTLMAKLTMNKAAISGITLTGISYPYDGTAKSLKITGALPIGTAVTYTNNNRIDAGTQRVTATISGINYVDLILTADLSVNKATMSSITFVGASFVYDGKAKSLAISGALPVGLALTYTGNGQTEAGEYTVTATIAGDNNYMDGELILTAKLIIKKAQQVISFREIQPVYRDAGTLILDISSNSPLPIQLRSDNALVAEVIGDAEVTIKGIGLAMIRAEQKGDANHEDAVTIVRELRVLSEDGARLPIRVHKAVSPNGDGINDYLRIEGIDEYPENQIVIFNVNGNLIREIKGYANRSNHFDGVKDGQAIPAGTYFYKLEVKINGKWKYDKGFFVLRY